MTTEDRATRYANIRDQVLHLRQMLDDIGLVIGGHIDNRGFYPQPLALRDFLQRVVHDQQIHAGSRHQLILDYSGPADNISLDSDLLRHILNGLLSNAFKYSPPGSEVTLHVSVNHPQAIFELSDHGLGIPAEDHPHVFKALHRSSNVAHLTGVGLGLKIVRDCVDLHRGTIHFSSKPGLGTTFTVCLPTDTTA